ncbi:MAG: guanylate kinase [Myxococcota bacterium]|nr:guanylate kinase [Myxococcota bacterium]
MSRRGLPFVVSAPSGTGKTTVCRAIVERLPGIAFSVSHTTRLPREGEVDGRHYHFVTRERFDELVSEGAFLEHAEYAGNAYGTSWEAIDTPLLEGQDLLLEVEVQGAAQIRERRDDARFVFLLPPSLAELEQRLRSRGTDSDEAVARRLAIVSQELAAVHGFDYAVVNRDLEEAIAAVAAIIEAERRGETHAVEARHGRAGVVAEWGEALGIAPPGPDGPASGARLPS